MFREWLFDVLACVDGVGRGKWAWVDGSGSKVLFAQMECFWVLGISSKFPVLVVPYCSHSGQSLQSKTLAKYRQIVIFCSFSNESEQ